MTEMAVISISTSPKVLGSLLPGCEVKVLGDNGKFLGPHQIGEILAKTPTMMKGYINNAKENAQFFDGDDGFAHTGYGNTGCGVFKRGIQN